VAVLFLTFILRISILLLKLQALQDQSGQKQFYKPSINHAHGLFGQTTYRKGDIMDHNIYLLLLADIGKYLAVVVVVSLYWNRIWRQAKTK